jgi:hypothetical protein
VKQPTRPGDEHEALVREVAAVDSFRGSRWVAAYRRASDEIRAREGGARPTGAGRDPDAVVVRALVFAQRTRWVLDGLWDPDEVRGRRIIDIGAGTGPVALEALAKGASSVVSVEPSTAEHGWMKAVRDHLKDDRWELVRGVARDELSKARAGDVWVWGYSFRETTRGEPEDGARFVRRLLEAGAEVLIVEPGTQPSARHLQQVRDLVPEAVVRPCRGVRRCPRLQEPGDWCHFTWRQTLGPEAHRLEQAAGRRANLLHFSYLHLRPGGPGLQPGFRLLEIRPRGRKRLDLVGCGPEGLREWTIPPRPRELRRWGEGLEAGVLLDGGEAADQAGRGPHVLEEPLSEIGSPRST